MNVGLAALDGLVLLDVSDSGPGIPPAVRPRVFDRFHRLPAAGQTGCALGLSTVKRIAGIHGASIVLGERELGGLRVTVSFPAAGSPGQGRSGSRGV